MSTISECTLLRKLSFKSVMKFGKFADMSVQQVIDSKNKSYLRWVYYNSSMIDFLPEVLDVLGIIPAERISKPGEDKAHWNEIAKRAKESISKDRLSKHIINKCGLARSKGRLISFEKSNKVTRQGLAWKNQGH